MKQPVLVSIQVGRPRRLDGWSTGIFKEPVAGPVWLGRTGLDGDGQADPLAHGGPQKAVLGYAAGHYPHWRAELGIAGFDYGAFGENFTISGLDEEKVAIGDIYAVGQAVVQVSQPRQPCWKLARRWGRADLPACVVKTGRSGWYYQVLQEGLVEPGFTLDLLDRPFPRWTVARFNEVLYDPQRDPATVEELAACPLLPDAWRDYLLARR
ncbi:MAG: MOSC domain-containing protein [Acidobacteria bacterium]|nr:MOSC domain-containing protein [Acidobacteriota bacterium]